MVPDALFVPRRLQEVIPTNIQGKSTHTQNKIERQLIFQPDSLRGGEDSQHGPGKTPLYIHLIFSAHIFCFNHTFLFGRYIRGLQMGTGPGSELGRKVIKMI